MSSSRAPPPPFDSSMAAFFESCLMPIMLVRLARWLTVPKPVAGDYYYYCDTTMACYYTLEKVITSSATTFALLERLEDSSMLEE